MPDTQDRKLFASAQGILVAICGHRGTRDQLEIYRGELYCKSCHRKKLDERPTIRGTCGHVGPAEDFVSCNLGTLCKTCYPQEMKAAEEHQRKANEDLSRRYKYRGKCCWACEATEYLERDGLSSYACPRHR